MYVISIFSVLQSELSHDPAEDELLQIMNERMLYFSLHSIYLTTLVVSLQMKTFDYEHNGDGYNSACLNQEAAKEEVRRRSIRSGK